MTEALNKPANDASAVVIDRCGLCDAWLATGQTDPQSKQRMGVCRAGPPTAFILPGPPAPLDPHQRPTMNVMAQFPPMPEGGWCRQFDTPEEDDA